MWSKLPEAQKSAYQNRAAKAREQYQAALVRARRLNMVVFTWDKSFAIAQAEYNANKKAAAKADAAAPEADAPKKKKKRRDSEDAGERKKRKKAKKSKADKA